MNALWIIGLFILVSGVTAFALTLCRVAALGDRDVEPPRFHERPNPAHMDEWEESQEVKPGLAEEQAHLSLKRMSISS
jgi:hypothetical protein